MSKKFSLVLTVFHHAVEFSCKLLIAWRLEIRDALHPTSSHGEVPSFENREIPINKRRNEVINFKDMHLDLLIILLSLTNSLESDCKINRS